MKTIRAKCLFTTALVYALGGCSFQLYDKSLDDQAKAMKSGLAGVSFEDTFATAQANQNDVSVATTAAFQRLSEVNAKTKLFVVMSTEQTITGEDEGFHTVLDARWGELMCDDPTNCPGPDQVAEEWRVKFCTDASPYDEICAAWNENRLPVHFSRIVELGISDYDPTSLRIPGLRQADSADNVLIAAGRPAPKCVPKPIAEADLGKPARELPAPVPAIPDLDTFKQSLSKEVAVHAGPIYEDYINICAETLNAQYGLTWLVGTGSTADIGRAWNDWQGAMDKLTKMRLEARQLQATYEADDAAYKQAVKEIEESKPDAEEKAKDLLGKAGKALDAVAALNDFGIEFAAEERLKSLQEVIAILGGNSKASGNDKSTLTPEVRTNLAAIAGLPHLIDDSADLFAKAEGARLSPLMLELAYQEQVLNAAKRRIATQEAAVERQRQIYFAAVAEAGKIAQAEERLQDGSSLDGFSKKPLYELLKGSDQSPTAGQTALLDALTAYHESQAKFNTAQIKLLFDGAAADYQRNLEENQIALNQWLALSKSDSEILAAYFASGLKPQELAAFLLAAAGVGGIWYR